LRIPDLHALVIAAGNCHEQLAPLVPNRSTGAVGSPAESLEGFKVVGLESKVGIEL